MSTTFQEGDRVAIAERKATADDAKSGLYYDHFCGLTGTVQKIYPTQEVAVEIETDSLTEPIRNRHHDVQEAMKTRWLDGLSEEARNRLTEQERDFRLHYTILVSAKDLAKAGDAPARRATEDDLSAAEEAELRRRSATR